MCPFQAILSIQNLNKLKWLFMPRSVCRGARCYRTSCTPQRMALVLNRDRRDNLHNNKFNLANVVQFFSRYCDCVYFQHSSVMIRASCVQIPTQGPFPIRPPISLSLRFLSVIICPVIIKAKMPRINLFKKVYNVLNLKQSCMFYLINCNEATCLRLNYTVTQLSVEFVQKTETQW